MALASRKAPSVVGIPDAQRIIVRCRGKPPPVRRNSNVINSITMTLAAFPNNGSGF
jgi:hypothetical protein